MIDFAIVEALEQHYKTADEYVKLLESKKIKFLETAEQSFTGKGKGTLLIGLYT